MNRPEPKNAVNARLTPNRQTRPVENDQYAAFIARILRAYARRVSDGDIEALTDLAALSHQVEQAIAQAVAGLHTFGYSWAEIANQLGTTRQAAHQRYGKDTHP